MKTARNISSIISLLIFGVVLYMMFVVPARQKKQAFKMSFNGKVISTLEQKRSHYITVEITNNKSKCYIYISAIKDKRLYPQYLDSIFKEPDSAIMYLKKDQKKEIIPLEGIACLDINCSVKK
jgi:hypothetical protein